MIGGYELDGLHWTFGIMWLLSMLGLWWWSRVDSRRIKDFEEKEDENRRLREALEKYQPHQLPLETSRETEGLGHAVGDP